MRKLIPFNWNKAIQKMNEEQKDRSLAQRVPKVALDVLGKSANPDTQPIPPLPEGNPRFKRDNAGELCFQGSDGAWYPIRVLAGRMLDDCRNCARCAWLDEAKQVRGDDRRLDYCYANADAWGVWEGE